MGKEQKASVPKEAQVMAAILKDMNVTDFEPGVVNQMLEFTYRYVTQILDDARAFASYAKKAKTVEVDDVKLAVQMQVDRSFTAPPPRDLLLDVARTRNANPLPPIKPQCGLRLPPDRYCLSACNFRLKKATRSSGRGAKGGGGLSGGTTKPTVSMVTNKSGSNQQTVTLVQKQPSVLNAGPQHKIVTVNRPLIKVTSGPPGGVVPKFQVSSGMVGGVHIKTEEGVGPTTTQTKRKRDEDGS